MLIVLVVLISSCSSGNSKDNQANKLLEIPVLSLEQMTIEIPQTYVADIQARQFVEVRSKIQGFVEKIYVDEGEIVRKDQPLFQLSSTEYNELVNSATAKLMQSKAEEKGASLEVERLKILVDKNIFSSSELELAQSRLDMARSAIMESEAMLKNARLGLSYTTIRAPFDGMVDRIPYKTGSLINSGDLLTNITDIDEIFAYYKITENEYLEYMRGRIDRENFKKESTEGLRHALEATLEEEKEEITLILSDGQLYQHVGKVETMEADFEKGTGSIALRVRFPNPDGLLKHGASGKVQMTKPLENIFLIPQKATFEIQDYTYIYLVDADNKAQIRSFRPKGRYGLFYIADDFQEGDRIILEGIQLLKDGVAVNPQETSPNDVYETLETIAQATL
ncbi:MAG: efflux RND transporter periplasmic adaptor subunit [Lunatimonas sp.]|uniref:efflux RND transporter periplasmic adaptor subunit n=1 Tax=Lunatimonas sp. TaxID=2060141 RepID=UPI00263BDDC2|nr:efflux RND transporter periplasmic adaptor subunit [Lunatimonas sp.]MCC5939487.1 efflux RND transporter periplasmic adaptor subunit [Lunatimonas sp.]